MSEPIGTRILGLPGYREALDEMAQTLTLWIGQTAKTPCYCCRGHGISVRETRPTQRRVRDHPWGVWRVWLVVEVHQAPCPPCGRRTERVPFLAGKPHRLLLPLRPHPRGRRATSFFVSLGGTP